MCYKIIGVWLKNAEKNLVFETNGSKMVPDIFPSTGVYILSTKKVAIGAVSPKTLNVESKLRQCNLIHSDGISPSKDILWFLCDGEHESAEDVVILNR